MRKLPATASDSGYLLFVDSLSDMMGTICLQFAVAGDILTKQKTENNKYGDGKSLIKLTATVFTLQYTGS